MGFPSDISYFFVKVSYGQRKNKQTDKMRVKRLSPTDPVTYRDLLLVLFLQFQYLRESFVKILQGRGNDRISDIQENLPPPLISVLISLLQMKEEEENITGSVTST